MAEENQKEPNKEYIPEVKDELSKVSTNPKQNIFILVAVSLVGVFVVFNIFFSSADNKSDVKSVELPKNIIKPSTEKKDITPPSLPTLPSLTLPPPPPPVAPASLPSLPTTQPTLALPPTQSSLSAPALIGLQDNSSDTTKQRKDQKNQASIMAIGGSENGAKPKNPDVENLTNTITDLSLDSDYLLASGKMIDAILETAINSDTGAPQIRAIISRDVYSDSGKNILIPKGSKVFGSYSKSNSDPRVNITWHSIYYSSGHIINIAAQLVDNLGRQGAEGRFDQKNKERFANVVMTSAFNILAAKGIDAIVPPINNSVANQTAGLLATQMRTQVSSIALKVPNPPTQGGAQTAITQICSYVQSAIPDKSSLAYSNMLSQCTNLQSQVIVAGANYLDLITQAVNAANSAADQLVSSVNNTPTQSQQAALDGYTNISKTVVNMFGQNIAPTVTIPQGRPIRIEVIQNYVFPKTFINKVQLIK